MTDLPLYKCFAGYDVRFLNNKLTVTAEDAAFYDYEIAKLQSGNVEYGLYQYDHVAFLLIAIDDWKFDFDLNAFELLPSAMYQLLHSYNGDICFKIVTTRTRQLITERVFQFNSLFTQHLKDVLKCQVENYKTSEQVNKQVIMLTDALSTEEMFQEATVYTYSGDSR
ncbi:hypothetical protein [Niastella sp. OAS944]|uniref:hypothetical protein n=1 Tax=Niastella sp. OAS944 TaxID=2664089 RepID=UPI00347BEC75|nr:hypothetical protein [Chitinophagaceae bacterium OAS944]